MPATKLRTGFPQTDERFPSFAPIFGAQPLVHEPDKALEQALTDALVRTQLGELRADPWPEVSVGVLTSAASGALVGGVAAGAWTGVPIGAGLSASAWSAITLLNAWRTLGFRARLVLGVSTLLGAGAVATGVWARKRRSR